MLKKMRRRFIGAAMCAVFVILSVLAAVINIWNAVVTTDRLDRTLESVFLFEQAPREKPPERFELPEGDRRDGFLPEMEYTTRFFSVRYDKNGERRGVSVRFIASVSEAEALRYADAVMAGRSDAGYYGDYRYRVYDTPDGSIVIFLNAGMERRSVRTLLWISCVVAAAALLAVWLLLLPLSKRALMPYIRNMEQQKRFITDAGHEIKTPLTSIAASCDVIAMEHGEDEWTRNIKKQTDRLSKLVREMVMLSRFDEAQPFAQKAEFSLSDTAWEMAEAFASMAKAKGKHFEQDISDEVKLCGDKEAVSHMLSILLDNAVRYTDEGGQIRLIVSKKRGKAVITVWNTCHIEETTGLERLFDRFYRPDESRSRDTGGSGIGLSIAQAAARAHGGSITVKSEDGKSICFTVVI